MRWNDINFIFLTTTQKFYVVQQNVKIEILGQFPVTWKTGSATVFRHSAPETKWAICKKS